MKKITLIALAALSLALCSCNKEQVPVQSGQENGEKVYMTLSASVDETKATMSNSWKFAFTTGDKISLTNNQVSEYYTLTRDSQGNFTGEVTAPSSTATWYAYYPSNNVSLANQTGTKAGTAAYYALAGKQENVRAHSRTLNIGLGFQTSILVINNKLGTMDINVKTSDGKWVSGLAATSNAASFGVKKSSSKVTLLSATAVGTYHIVVPAGVQITIYNGSTKLKETKTAGLTAGKYYTINVTKPLPEGALPGEFSVSATKKVYFSKGNLYWNGSAFRFEENQYDCPNSRSASHIGHFFYSNTSSVAIANSYSDSKRTTTDVFFTNAAQTTAKSDFTVNGVTGIYRVLSKDEWVYLLTTRTVNGGKGENKSYSKNITHGGKKGLVLYPDDYTGSALSGTVTTLPEGVVFLPAAGGFSFNMVTNYNQYVYYWSSTPGPYNDDKAFNIFYNNSEFQESNLGSRDFGRSVRLVTEVN